MKSLVVPLVAALVSVQEAARLYTTFEAEQFRAAYDEANTMALARGLWSMAEIVDMQAQVATAQGWGAEAGRLRAEAARRREEVETALIGLAGRMVFDPAHVARRRIMEAESRHDATPSPP
jgi:putative aminopeptidase FrvX